jgi:hypothetical protein
MNIWSEGMGSWSYHFMIPLLSRTFPNTPITTDQSRPPNLVIKSNFGEPMTYTCPYICWSGESYFVSQKEYPPLFEFNTILSDRPNSIYFPHLFGDECMKHGSIKRPESTPKPWCCSFAYSRGVSQRESLFRSMRDLEPTCYAFGQSCFTHDNPFVLTRNDRTRNASKFNQFVFNVAMENTVAPGYITEKIGNAFNSGSIPIYWGAPEINDFFNPASFINVSNYANPEACGIAAVQIWRDPQKKQPYLDAPITLNSKVDDYLAIYKDYRPWQKKCVDILRETYPDLS